MSGDAANTVSLLRDGAKFILLGHWKDLGWWDVAALTSFALSELKSDCFDIKPYYSGEAVHSKILNLVGLVVTNIEDVTRVLLTVLLNAICEPSLRVASELVSVLCFQYLFTYPQWRFHVWIIIYQFFLKFFIFLLGIPVPLVNLLELKSCVFGELLELHLGGLALRVLVALLKGLDLVTRFSVPLEAHQS